MACRISIWCHWSSSEQYLPLNISYWWRASTELSECNHLVSVFKIVFSLQVFSNCYLFSASIPCSDWCTYLLDYGETTSCGAMIAVLCFLIETGYVMETIFFWFSFSLQECYLMVISISYPSSCSSLYVALSALYR